MVAADSDAPPGFSDLLIGNDGGTVEVRASRTTPGTPVTPGTAPPSFDDDDAPWYPPAEFQFDECLDNWNSYIRCFRANEDADATEPVEKEPALPAITITDLARFAPTPIAIQGEPDNVGVAGMPTNFVAPASAQTQTGTLFGTALTVRFTPAAYDFVYGDGTTATTTTPGQSWEALGQAPFTPTDTSHTYRERGTYQAGVTVRYTAEVDLGVGWFPVTGELAIEGPTQEIRIFEAHTALVARTCAEQPRAPGC